MLRNGFEEDAVTFAYPHERLQTARVNCGSKEIRFRPGFTPTIGFESRGPHTLLAMAERGHGVAVIPSALRTDRHTLRIVGLTYRGRPLQEPLALYWDKRRPLPRYAIGFGDMLAQHMRNVFPISRPSQSKTIAQKTVFGRRQPRSRRAR